MSFKMFQDYDAQNIARIVNLPSPTTDDQPARLADLKAAIEGLASKDNCRVAPQTNVNLASPGATIDGITMALNDRVLVFNQTDTSQNGIYLWNGAAAAMTRSADANTFDELENAITSVDEGTSAGTTYRQTQVNGTLSTSAVLWTVFGATVPAATTTTSGQVRLATQAEADTGTNNAIAITPLTLKNFAGGKKLYAAAFGDGTASQYDFTHSFGTRNVEVQVFRNSSPWDNVGFDIERPDANTVRVRSLVAVTTNQFVVMILG